MRLNQNQSGFSLIGVLTSVAIVGVITAGMITAMSNAWQNLAAQDSKVGQLALAQDIRTEISDPGLCKSGLANETGKYNLVDGKQILSMKMRNGKSVAKGLEVDGYNVTVEKFEFVPAGFELPLPGNKKAVFGDMELYVRGTKGGKLHMNKSMVGKIYFVVDAASNAIEDCMTANGTSLTGACSQPPDVTMSTGAKIVPTCTTPDGKQVRPAKPLERGPAAAEIPFGMSRGSTVTTDPDYAPGTRCTGQYVTVSAGWIDAAGGTEATVSMQCENMCVAGLWMQSGCTLIGGHRKTTLNP